MHWVTASKRLSERLRVELFTLLYNGLDIEVVGYG